MATSPSRHFVSRLAAIAFCALGLSACDAFEQPKDPPEPPVGRYVIVVVDGVEPGSRETIEIDTATGFAWRLVKSNAPGTSQDIGWHPIANLTTDGLTPYYRGVASANFRKLQGQ